MRIHIDRSRCIGAGQCAVMAEALFTQDETDGLVVVLNDTPAPDDEAAAEMAEMACPSRAIRIARD